MIPYCKSNPSIKRVRNPDKRSRSKGVLLDKQTEYLLQVIIFNLYIYWEVEIFVYRKSRNRTP